MITANSVTPWLNEVHPMKRGTYVNKWCDIITTNKKLEVSTIWEELSIQSCQEQLVEQQ